MTLKARIRAALGAQWLFLPAMALLLALAVLI